MLLMTPDVEDQGAGLLLPFSKPGFPRRFVPAGTVVVVVDGTVVVVLGTVLLVVVDGTVVVVGGGAPPAVREVSSRTNDVCREAFSLHVNLSVTV